MWGLGAKLLYLFLTYLTTETTADRLRNEKSDDKFGDTE